MISFKYFIQVWIEYPDVTNRKNLGAGKKTGQ